MNGSPYTNFSWNASTQILQITTTQNSGNSYTFVITASNQFGSDAKSVTINCPTTTPTPANPPAVTIISPNQPVVNYQGNNCNVNIVALVTGTTAQNQITITYNGSPFTNWTWNSNSQHVNINMQNVNTASNVFVITATTTAGTDSKTVTFNCQAPPPPPPPPTPAPTVTIISPNQSVVNYQGNNCNVNIVALITGVTSQNQITVTYNGNPYIGFTWNTNSQHVNINMQNVSTATNIFVITATTPTGTDSTHFSSCFRIGKDWG